VNATDLSMFPSSRVLIDASGGRIITRHSGRRCRFRLDAQL
jgi:hypothetical protein